MTVRIPAILLALAFLVASSNLSFGQTFWQAGTADWFAAANWTLGVPVHPADAVIANGGTAQILRAWCERPSATSRTERRTGQSTSRWGDAQCHR